MALNNFQTRKLFMNNVLNKALNNALNNALNKTLNNFLNKYLTFLMRSKCVSETNKESAEAKFQNERLFMNNVLNKALNKALNNCLNKALNNCLNNVLNYRGSTLRGGGGLNDNSTINVDYCSNTAQTRESASILGVPRPSSFHVPHPFPPVSTFLLHTPSLASLLSLPTDPCSNPPMPLMAETVKQQNQATQYPNELAKRANP